VRTESGGIQPMGLGGLGKASGTRPSKAWVHDMRNRGDLARSRNVISGTSAAAQHACPAMPLQQWLTQPDNGIRVAMGIARATSVLLTAGTPVCSCPQVSAAVAGAATAAACARCT